MKKVIITGANGFSGGTLIRALEGTQWEPIPFSQFETGLKNEVVVDFCSEQFENRLKALQKIDAVVHLGARVGWDGSTREQLYKPNVEATAKLAQWAAAHGIYLVFASAATICGEKNPHITAGCSLNTQNDYLYTKWQGEEAIKASGVKHANLRISGIFGKNGPEHLGINRAITGALKGTPPVQYGDGKIKRNYVYVKDLCNIIKHCIDNEIEGTHLTAGTHVNTLAEMLQTICEILKPGLKPEHRPGGGGNHQVVDHSPALPPCRTFAEAIKDIK